MNVLRRMVGRLGIMERSPRVRGLRKYYVKHKDGRVLEEFTRYAPAVRWAKANRNAV